jgi:hypothetical protein
MPILLPDAIASARKSRVPDGATVFRQGQACARYLVVTQGSMRIFARSAAGKEVVLYHVGPGEICVITTSCLLSDVPYPAEAVAETEVRVKVIPKQEFDRLLAASPTFREFVFAAFGGRLADLIPRGANFAGIDPEPPCGLHAATLTRRWGGNCHPSGDGRDDRLCPRGSQPNPAVLRKARARAGRTGSSGDIDRPELAERSTMPTASSPHR